MAFVDPITTLGKQTFPFILSVHNEGPDFDMSFFFPCEIDDAIQYINLRYGAQAPKIVIL